jgi:ornithine cyclodeaminase/alanine dehydrogenase-like protein (mu-crystallin family)
MVSASIQMNANRMNCHVSFYNVGTFPPLAIGISRAGKVNQNSKKQGEPNSSGHVSFIRPRSGTPLLIATGKTVR